MFKSLHSREAKIFCKNLIAARKACDLTQREIAIRLGNPQSYISKIESGERRLDVIEFWRIYKILGKSFEFYFQFDEKPEGSEKKSKTLKAASGKRKKKQLKSKSRASSA
ncbi:helix-turn-helix domain-containing protein [Leptospira santarosai]|uniref:Transcriptional regulator n=4 Tax=Leptospira santarosai TaxID=28183 RepID=A0AB73LYP4_9LEPT|nr:helix-turn-helix transcriptional regulator [Leptospira santarosai]EMO56618.1 DNA-binding helix-turn-helix protein [Leptospira santarosai str. CBC1416]AVV50065.1 DNA-binding helix-turn-helix protein [Leptospira santarosai]EKR93230.1 DNA-binding helix-turn-helix protein [Leptospira santarosai str. CBC379]EMM87317.1 DNA-binding helix-turn-helix protein [Leptospira santarosai str. 2000027870]EMN20466.1 DNA-binding helix-turn-helix protein [Leptospira santarosai serovar Arenal str. MAVJ 401]